MKKLNEIKQDKSLSEIYKNALEELFKKITGQVLHYRRTNFDPVLVTEMIHQEDGTIKISLLYKEKILTRHYNDWNCFEQDFMFNSEYEKRKEGLELARKMREGLEKARNYKSQNTFRRPGYNPSQTSKISRRIGKIY